MVLVDETCHSARKNTRPTVCYGGKYYCIMAALWVQCKDKQEGWEPAFLIKGICLSGKLMTCFDFAFFYLGLKCQNLRLKLKGPSLARIDAELSTIQIVSGKLARLLASKTLWAMDGVNPCLTKVSIRSFWIWSSPFFFIFAIISSLGRKSPFDQTLPRTTWVLRRCMWCWLWCSFTTAHNRFAMRWEWRAPPDFWSCVNSWFAKP